VYYVPLHCITVSKVEVFGVQTLSEIWSAALHLYQRPSIKLSGQNKCMVCMVHIKDE